MRLFLIISSFLLVTSSILLGVNYFSNQDVINNSNHNQKQKVITVTIKIKDNLPLVTDIHLKTKYYFRLLNNKVSLISLINNLNLATKYFNFLQQDLNYEITDNYTLYLDPKPSAIMMYHRFNITYDVLVAIGLKSEDAKQVIKIFHDVKLSGTQVIEQLKAILTTKKRKLLPIMQKFITF